ncbi:Mut7-C RNAse domain-containing protein [Halomonas sp. WWR20]
MTPPHSQTRFLADEMLGRLARWLRVLGFDTFYACSLNDHALVRIADEESRVLLTRDRHLVTYLRPAQSQLVTHDAPLAQLREVIESCRLSPPDQLFTRCLVCNACLREANDREIAMFVPEAALALPGPVRRCPGCQRIYWPGSHTWRMRDTLTAALPDWFSRSL